MSDTLGSFKDAILSKASLTTLFHGKFGGIVKDNMKGIANSIPVKYQKLASVVTGALVAASPVLFKFIKKKQWVFYILIGLAEILATVLSEKEKEQRTVVYTAL